MCVQDAAEMLELLLASNAGSIRVLGKNGFRHEGLAERYLQINGTWEDHLIYALTSEEWPAARDRAA